MISGTQRGCLTSKFTKYTLSYHLLHSFWVPGVSVHANGAVLIKMAFSILESVAFVELIGATFKYATLYKLI